MVYSFGSQTQQTQKIQEEQMGTGVRSETGRKGPPLTREDVMRLLKQAGSPTKLNLSGMNLSHSDLSNLNLASANLSGAYLEGANLYRADLREADLQDADLSNADLREANLLGANLERAMLTQANVAGATADYRIMLAYRDVRPEIHYEVSEEEHNHLLSEVVRERLLREGVTGVEQIHLHSPISSITRGAIQGEGQQLRLLFGAIQALQSADTASLLHGKPDSSDFLHLGKSLIFLRISETPLTVYNLATILTALTELYTKYWLVAKGRYAELIEYTQTRDSRFAREAGATIAWATYNSPFNFGFQVDRLVPGTADAIITVVDGITQRKAKLETKELENQEASQRIRENEQKAEHEQKMAALELEQKRLELKKQELAVIEQRLELEKKAIEYGYEITEKALAALSPELQQDMKAVVIQTTLSNILQLQRATGLELIPRSLKDQAEEA